MTAAATPMHERIGAAVTALLSLTDSGDFGPTASPISIEIEQASTLVTFHGAKGNGDDVQIAIRIWDAAVTGQRRITAFRRDWNDEAGTYGGWNGCDEAEAAFAAVTTA